MVHKTEVNWLRRRHTAARWAVLCQQRLRKSFIDINVAFYYKIKIDSDQYVFKFEETMVTKNN